MERSVTWIHGAKIRERSFTWIHGANILERPSPYGVESVTLDITETALHLKEASRMIQVAVGPAQRPVTPPGVRVQEAFFVDEAWRHADMKFSLIEEHK